MTELVLKGRKWALDLTGPNSPINSWRLIVLLGLMSLLSISPEIRHITLSAISDAYLQVTVFVAGTLALVYAFERAFGVDLGRVMAKARHFQSPMAAFLGALPGCGGAIIVITQYTRGYATFGSVVAVLIATMGDAAFLLIAREPQTGLMMMTAGLVIGTISGWIVDWYHGPEFMRAEPTSAAERTACYEELKRREDLASDSKNPLKKIWVWLVVPAGILGLMAAFQLDTDAIIFSGISEYEPTIWIGALGGLLCVVMWAFSRRQSSQLADREAVSMTDRVVKDTNFVTSWVVLGFLTYELGTHFAGGGIESWLQVWAPLVPLIAILVGFIPGCGPQIVVTSLYLAGAIPLSAQLGNAISNDGDALFPAIALAPKAALLATIYSAVPAVLVAYGYFYFVEFQ